MPNPSKSRVVTTENAYPRVATRSTAPMHMLAIATSVASTALSLFEHHWVGASVACVLLGIRLCRRRFERVRTMPVRSAGESSSEQGLGGVGDGHGAIVAVGSALVTRRLTRPLRNLTAPSTFSTENTMPKYVIERAIPGLGDLNAAELQAAAQKSCSVLQQLGPDVQWVQSYVTSDKMYCIYNAANEGLVREHAKRGGFPADVVARVVTVIDPVTAES